jgi:hypothetical protein
MAQHGFQKWVLPVGKDIFHILSQSVAFEAVAKGRQGNHLVAVGESGIPIVRTTTQYNLPAQNFAPIHHQIVENIQQKVPDAHFNNALIEIYDRDYAKMKYHSDQCLDMAKNSYIALFSCYEQPENIAQDLLRRLKVKNKTTEEEFEITLEHNSVVLFDLPTNAIFQHKIVLEQHNFQHKNTLETPKGVKPSLQDNRWLGITFRQSKTFIHFKENLPYFADGTPLLLAGEEQSKEFYQLKSQENHQPDFVYPFLAYTLSAGDRLLPQKM